MIHLKTYENFISKGLNKIWNKLTEPDHGQLIHADWDKKELDKLEELGFSIDLRPGNRIYFKSVMSDLQINISKYYEEEYPGYAPVIYKVNAQTNDKYYSKTFSKDDFDKMKVYISGIIPEEELNAKKYNL